MERMKSSKLTGAFVALLLLAAAVTTASAQTKDELAAKGFAIAERDPVVAAARFSGEPDAFYLLGFDIATGIFGDPALGALGNTATGPGSLGIRDSLNAAGQRGFNASVKLHLSRHYKRTAGEVTAVDTGNRRSSWFDPAIQYASRIIARAMSSVTRNLNERTRVSEHEDQFKLIGNSPPRSLK